MSPLQGVVRSFDPVTGAGVLVCDSDLRDYEFTAEAIAGSVFRTLRQGQRIVFDVEADQAVRLRLGSEVDMGTPGFEQPNAGSAQHPQGGSAS